MKKSEFWGPFLFGILFLLPGIILLSVPMLVKEKGLVGIDYFICVLVGLVCFAGGLSLVMLASGNKTKGKAIEGLLDRMEYKRDIEFREENDNFTHLLLHEADKKGGFSPDALSYKLKKESLLDKDGKVLKETPDVFLVRTGIKEEKTTQGA